MDENTHSEHHELTSRYFSSTCLALDQRIAIQTSYISFSSFLLVNIACVRYMDSLRTARSKTHLGFIPDRFCSVCVTTSYPNFNNPLKTILCIVLFVFSSQWVIPGQLRQDPGLLNPIQQFGPSLVGSLVLPCITLTAL